MLFQVMIYILERERIVLLSLFSLFGTLNHLLNIHVMVKFSTSNKCIKKGDSITYNFCFPLKIHNYIAFDSSV